MAWFGACVCGFVAFWKEVRLRIGEGSWIHVQPFKVLCMTLKLEIQLSRTASVWVAVQLTDRQRGHTGTRTHTLSLRSACHTNMQVEH